MIEKLDQDNISSHSFGKNRAKDIVLKINEIIDYINALEKTKAEIRDKFDKEGYLT